MNKYPLHDPYNINHVHGLRKRLFRTFNELFSILNNIIFPPVLETSKKKVQIKIEEYDLRVNYIYELNLMLLEIKKELKNGMVNYQKTNRNAISRKSFQIQLIQCYKLAIKTIKICSNTLKAGIYHPIQNRIKKLIQIISYLSLNTGLYIYGELFKKKKKESYDLVQHCKELVSILDTCGYKDTENEVQDNNLNNNILNELANKAITKNKLFSVNCSQLSMYKQVKPKLGCSNKLIESTKNKDIENRHSHNVEIKNEKLLLFKKNKPGNPSKNNNLSNLKTAVEELSIKELNDSNKGSYKEKFNKIQNNPDKVINISSSSSSLLSYQIKTVSNVGIFIVQENPWKHFPIKDAKVSQKGILLLNMLSKDITKICEYKRQYNDSEKQSEYQIVNKIVKSIMEEVLNEVISKIIFNMDNMIKQLIIQESKWLDNYVKLDK